MDPHSTRAQFNTRLPKAGPAAHKYMDTPQKDKLPLPKSSRKASSPAPSDGFIRRPIATNSRITGDNFRKDMHLAFVTNALAQKAKGSPESFDELVNQFNAKNAPQPAQLRLWISALSHVVSRLERKHASLVQAVVGMPWTTMDPATVKVYTVFIGTLLSARPEYLSLVLGKITHGFTYRSGLQALDANTPEGSSSPMTRRIIYDRLHYLLQHLLSLIPTLPSTLQPLLVRNFPHKRQNQAAQTTYIRNLLRISSYCPELSDKIMSTIVDRAIQIDVEIQVELEELEEQTDQDQEVFELDPFDTVLGQEEDDSDSDDDSDDEDLEDLSSDDGEGKLQEPVTDMQHIQEMVKKLDTILTLVFQHFGARPQAETGSPPSSDLPELPPLPPITPTRTPISYEVPPSTPEKSSPPPTVPAPPSLHAQFNTLLAIFDRIILPTFKSRYTQFLVFYYTSLSTDFTDIFLGLLVDRALFQTNTPAVTRAAAAAYIGSFVSRAAFVDRDGARRVVGVLCDFMRSHLDAVEEGLRLGAPVTTLAGNSTSSQSGVFYAVAQAVFLVFCFRWRDLLEDEEEGDELVSKAGKKWIPELAIVPRTVQSVLNPLKICSPNVVQQFARIAQATGFVYCYTILDANRRSEYSGANGASLAILLNSGISAELNTFFPFDPYKLVKSGAYIEGIYREWSSVAIDDDDDEDDESDEEIEDDTARRRRYSSEGSGLDIPLSRSVTMDDHGLDNLLSTMKTVFLDIDPGHDDATALLLALHSLEINLLGISTTHGNASSDWTMRNAARCLHAFGAATRYPDVRVFPGAVKPLIRPAKYAPSIHGVDGLGGVEGLPDAQSPEVEKWIARDDRGEVIRALDGLSGAVRRTWDGGRGKKVFVISCGPMTNIALFVSVYPDLLEGVEEFVFMGGGVGMGNMSPVAEFNILCDPHAAQIVLNAPVKKVMIPLNVTHTAIVTRAIHAKLLSPSTAPLQDAASPLPRASTSLRHMLSTLISFFADTYKTTFGFNDGPPLHDALTVAYVAYPEWFQEKRFRVDIELTGTYSSGETVVDVWDYKASDPTSWGVGGKNCLVTQAVDLDKFFEFLLESITGVLARCRYDVTRHCLPSTMSAEKSYHLVCTGAAHDTVESHSTDQDITLFGACFYEVDPYKKPAELLEVSPKGLVPGLKLHKYTPARGLNESTVILEYLEDLAAQTTRLTLLPRDPYARALVRLQCDHINRAVVPAFYRFLQAQEESTQLEGAKEFRVAIDTLVAMLERTEVDIIGAGSSGPAEMRALHVGLGLWHEGGELNMTDVMVGPWIFRATNVLKHYRGFEFPASMKFQAWTGRLFAHPAFAATCSTEELYLDSYERYAQNRPNTSQVANAINAGKPLP
ncbi:RNA polymerase I-specific transcription initiation factor RRN3 [Mycena kentingensis (nom. inval.)]|nr:RNA polymerase I-specific transcription initiation factor RRN3 [Mycena kentingensis (nom. inval.)]